MSFEELAEALDGLLTQLRVKGYRLLLLFVHILRHLAYLDLAEDFKHLKIVLVAFQNELFLVLQRCRLLRLLDRLAALFYFCTVVVVLANLVGWDDIDKDLTKGGDSLQNDIDVLWILAEREQVTQLAIAESRETDDLSRDSLHNTKFLSEAELSDQFWCDLFAIGRLLLLLDIHFFDLLVGGAESFVFVHGLLSSNLAKTVLTRLLDRSPVRLLLLTSVVSTLFTK